MYWETQFAFRPTDEVVLRGVRTPIGELIPAPEQHESAYLLPENAVDGEVVFGI
jgi:hypothetical protein